MHMLENQSLNLQPFGVKIQMEFLDDFHRLFLFYRVSKNSKLGFCGFEILHPKLVETHCNFSILSIFGQSSGRKYFISVKSQVSLPLSLK